MLSWFVGNFMKHHNKDLDLTIILLVLSYLFYDLEYLCEFVPSKFHFTAAVLHNMVNVVKSRVIVPRE